MVFFMFFAYFFAPGILHWLLIDSWCISGTLDHVKKAFQRYTLHKKQDFEGSGIARIYHCFRHRFWRYFLILLHTFCNAFSAWVSRSIFVMILGCFWLRPGTGCGSICPPKGINFMKKSGNGGPWTLLGFIVLHAGYTVGTQGCLLDRSEEHFHGFLTISVCPSDDSLTFWGRHQTY